MPNSFIDQLNNSLVVVFIVAIIIIISIGVVVLLFIRSRAHARGKVAAAFGKVILLITVPKESEEADNKQIQASQYIKNQIGLAESLFTALGGLRAQRGLKAMLNGRNDHFSLEIVASGGLISFYLAIPRYLQSFIQQMILAQYPQANLQEVAGYNIFLPRGKTDGCTLVQNKEYVFPIKTYMHMEADPLQSITNSLSKVAQGESAVIQIIARSAKKEWHRWGYNAARELQKGEKLAQAIKSTAPGFTFTKFAKFFSTATDKSKKMQNQNNLPPQLTPLAQETIKSLEEKTAKAGLDVNIRLLVSANNQNNAERYLNNLFESFNQYNFYQYGNSFVRKKENLSQLIQEFIYREYNNKYRAVLNAEELASIFHFPHNLMETPNIRWLLAKRLPPPVNAPPSGILLGINVYQGTETPIFMKESDRRRHMYIIGMTGTGKSTMMENMAIQDILAGNGVGVIDPHGSLVENILNAIPAQRADDVILFDASDIDRPYGLNMLEAESPQQKDLAIQEMIAIFYKLVTDPSMIGPMFEHNMRNAMLTLMSDQKEPGTIVDIPRIFTDPDFQKVKMENVTDPLVRNYWEKEMKKTSDFHKSEMLGYLISKVGRFVENDLVRNIIGQRHSSFSLRDVMDNNKILLVNLSKGKIGEINSSLLGLIVVSKLQMAALSRADLPEEQRKDFYLYIDEFQNFITDSISVILAEARKYKLNLILAHQYIGQLTGGSGVEGKAGNSKVRDAIFGNVGTIASFRIGVDDAETVAKQLAPGVSQYDVMNIEKYNAYARLLIDNQATRPFSIRTKPPYAGDPARAQKIRQLSRLKYGRDVKLVEKDIIESLKVGAAKINLPNAEKTL